MHNRKCGKKILDLLILICLILPGSKQSSACDKSRKVFSGVNYGEVSDGVTYYTQVGKFVNF